MPLFVCQLLFILHCSLLIVTCPSLAKFLNFVAGSPDASSITSHSIPLIQQLFHCILEARVATLCLERHYGLWRSIRLRMPGNASDLVARGVLGRWYFGGSVNKHTFLRFQNRIPLWEVYVSQKRKVVVLHETWEAAGSAYQQREKENAAKMYIKVADDIRVYGLSSKTANIDAAMSLLSAVEVCMKTEHLKHLLMECIYQIPPLIIRATDPGHVRRKVQMAMGDLLLSMGIDSEATQLYQIVTTSFRWPYPEDYYHCLSQMAQLSFNAKDYAHVIQTTTQAIAYYRRGTHRNHHLPNLILLCWLSRVAEGQWDVWPNELQSILTMAKGIQPDPRVNFVKQVCRAWHRVDVPGFQMACRDYARVRDIPPDQVQILAQVRAKIVERRNAMVIA